MFSLLEVALTGAATWLAVKAIRVHRRWWRLLALLLLATVAAFGYMVFVGVWLLTTSCAVAV